MSPHFFEYNGFIYPEFIRQGNHAQYVIPIARKFCLGQGIDIGFGRADWAFPEAQRVDMCMPPPWNDALKIPNKDETYDFVFSSHCLEHIGDYYSALLEWTRILKNGGVLFLYLPDVKCEYWRPANNRKHKHVLHREDIKYDFTRLGFKHIVHSDVDLAYSYSIVGVK